MAISMKSMLVAAGCAALVAGCATGPYYDNYGYGGYGSGYGYGSSYGSAYGPAYYGHPGYVAPSVGIGFGSTYYYDQNDRRHYRDRDDRREWRGDRDGRRDWRGDGDGRREWRGEREGSIAVAPPDNYRGPRNHAGEPIGPGYRSPPGSDSPG